MKLDFDAVEELFQLEQHQSDIVVLLYKMVYKDEWNNIKKLHGFPQVSRETNEYFFGKFITFDKKHHPEVFPGGLWLNNGFSCEDNITDFLVVEPCENYERIEK